MRIKKADGVWIEFELDPATARQLTAEEAQQLEQKRQTPPINLAPAPTGGAGTELKKIFARFRLLPTTFCRCAAIAARMNREGVDWCEQNLEFLLDEIAAEAARRKLPFVRPFVAKLIQYAIHKARKKQTHASLHPTT